MLTKNHSSSRSDADGRRRSAVTSLPASLLLIGLLLCMLAVSAQAARVHNLLSSEAPPNPSFEHFFSLAVNQSTHHFDTVTFAGSGGNRVYNFTAAGVPDPVEPELTGIHPFEPQEIAVDSSGGPQDGYIYTTDAVSSIQQFDPTGTPTAVHITAASIPPNGTAQGGGLPPVVNHGVFSPAAVAVDGAGNIFVVDNRGDNPVRAIDEFTPAGTFVAQLDAGIITQSAMGIAIDSSGHIFLANGAPGGFGEGLFELDSTTGACVQAGCAPIDSAPIQAVTVDRSTGTVFTVGIDNGQSSFSEYDATGNLLGRTDLPGLEVPGGIAVDEASGNLILTDVADLQGGESTVQAYGPVEIVPDVETEAADPVTDHSATFHGKIGAAEVPGGATCVFQYVSEAGFKESGFKGAAKAPCDPAGPFEGSAMSEVHAEVSTLTGGTTYRYRLLGTNQNGSIGDEDLPFTTLGPIVSETEASEVTETSALLRSLIERRDADEATYAFQYATQSQFEANGYGEATSVPVPAGAVPLQTSGTGKLKEGNAVVKDAVASEGTFLPGQTIEGQGIPPETKIVSVKGEELTLSKNATESLQSVTLTATGFQLVSQSIGGLTPDTLYHFRIATTSTGGGTAGTTFSEDRTFSTYPPPLVGLPDGRSYEQASPVDKNGANIQGEAHAVQASTDGNRITFVSLAGIPGGEGESTLASYMASRAPDGSSWSTRGMLPPASYGPHAEVAGWDEELASVYTFASGLTGSTSLLVRASANGLLSEFAQVVGSHSNTPFFIAGASSDGGVALLESKAGGLLPGDLAGKQNVYAYDRETGELLLAGVMNDGSVASGGAMGGPYNWYPNGGDPSLGRPPLYYTQPNHAISTDGRRIFFTSGTGQLYVRQNPLAQQSPMNGEECTEAATKACTTRVSAPQAGVTDPGTNAVFSWASADGSLVYFLDKGRLTADSTAGSGYDLYRYDVESGELSDLTVDTADGHGAQVRSVLGVGANGEDAYFVAAGALAPGAEKAPPNETNIYALHGEEVVFIARLSTTQFEERNWAPVSTTGSFFPRASRVSADGQALLFTSQRQLTSYRNHGDPELYLYRRGRELQCVSCNPTGEAPRGGAGVQAIPKPGVSTFHNSAIMTRNLSSDGRRVIFDSSDRLVSADENKVNDVYEWEEKGKGSCQSEAQDGGCLFLISSGTSSRPSYFGDADTEGDNVFFFTTDQLVAQDKDELVDLYDAKVDGGIAAQNRVSPPPCEGEACLGQGSSGQGAQTPGTSTFSGPGNPGTTRPPACTKGRARKHGRCVKQSHAKKKKHAKKHHKQRRSQGAKGGSGR